jgi:hypothetical protein
MSEGDRLLRAAVWSAYDERTPDGRVRRDAAERVVTVHALWPLVEYAHAIESAEAELKTRRAQELAAELAWYASIGVIGPEREIAGVC